MNAQRLGLLLREMYHNATSRKKVTMIHLFGIRYAQQLRLVSLSEVVDEAGISSAYATELRKALNLSEFVQEIPVKK